MISIVFPDGPEELWHVLKDAFSEFKKTEYSIYEWNVWSGKFNRHWRALAATHKEDPWISTLYKYLFGIWSALDVIMAHHKKSGGGSCKVLEVDKRKFREASEQSRFCRKAFRELLAGSLYNRSNFRM